jgi:hypothetical protein
MTGPEPGEINCNLLHIAGLGLDMLSTTLIAANKLMEGAGGLALGCTGNCGCEGEECDLRYFIGSWGRSRRRFDF